MRIPDIALRLRELAIEQSLPELEALAGHLRRRTPPKKAEPTSAPLTSERAAEIRAYAVANPHIGQVEIGRVFNVNQGRVSEVLRGKRT